MLLVDPVTPPLEPELELEPDVEVSGLVLPLVPLPLVPGPPMAPLLVLPVPVEPLPLVLEPAVLLGLVDPELPDGVVVLLEELDEPVPAGEPAVPEPSRLQALKERAPTTARIAAAH